MRLACTENILTNKVLSSLPELQHRLNPLRLLGLQRGENTRIFWRAFIMICFSETLH